MAKKHPSGQYHAYDISQALGLIAKATVQRGEDDSDPDPLTVSPYLGSEDAESEWRALLSGDLANSRTGPLNPAAAFLHITAYEEFKKPQILFLYGRRGTGKTAILRMLQHETRSGALRQYRACWGAGTGSASISVASGTHKGQDGFAMTKRELGECDMQLG